MVGRFIQHQDVYAGIDQLRERESSLLSSRKIAYVLVNLIAKKEKLGEKRSSVAGCRRGRSDPTQLHDDLVTLIEILQLLRVVTSLDFAAPTNLST